MEGFLKNLAEAAGLDLSMMDKGRCVRCRESVKDRIKSEAGWREYAISGLCEVCWKEIFPNA